MKGKLARIGKRFLASTLVTALLLSGFVFTDVYYGLGDKVNAASLSGSSASVSAPTHNNANLPAMDTTGTVAYWYAGNKFLALNQFNGGAKQAGQDITIGSTTVSDGTMKWYRDDAYGYRGVETTNEASERGDKLAIMTDLRGGRGATNDNGGSTTTILDGDGTTNIRNHDKQVYVQSQTNDFFSDGTVWELMDSDAVWDDDYLFAQYQAGTFNYVTAAFSPTILNSVESWYSNGFSYNGGGTAVSAQGDYFSAAEKALVKSATITTDGVTGSSNTSSNDTITAHLFAPSVDEVYYNPMQVKSIWSAFSADYGDGSRGAGRSDNASWQYPRSHLWLRSFWGVNSNSHRNGVHVNSTGALDFSNVAHEFAVAPAFYLDTTGVVMAKDATNATASAVASGSSALAAYDASTVDDNKSVKFLVPASGFASDFTTSISQKSADVNAGTTYSVNYSGATTDNYVDSSNDNNSGLFVSAIVYGEDGQILYYGNLGKVTGASGSVNLTIPSLSSGSYTLALFEEQVGGTSKYTTSGGVEYVNYETDYQSAGISYSTINIESSENATGFDTNTWYEYEDETTGIVWKYKLNSNGDVIGLYTETADISSIIDSGNCLNVPSKINGRTVIAIGSEDEEHPFILPSQIGWTSISFPSSMTTINDYAFSGSMANAKIVIPSNITAIGVKAFYNSNISSLVLSEFNGKVGSYAFASTSRLTTVTIKGGSAGLTLSSVTFADSALTDVSITGTVTVNKKAFRDNTSLKNINLNGTIILNESAFSGCSAVDNLNISGSVTIGSYAFNGCTALQSLYLPAGTRLSEYAFNGCTGITSLEADCALPAHSFEGTGNITLMILDEGCTSVAYNWEGNSTNFGGDTASQVVANDATAKTYNYTEYTNPGRTIYARSSNVLYGFASGASSLGASGSVELYIPNDRNYDTGIEIKSGDTLSLFGMTLFSSASYDSYKTADGAVSVMVTPIGNFSTFMENNGITALADTTTEKEWDGISAYYTGSILTTKDIDKESMKVIKMYGAEEGEEIPSTGYYVIRTSEFNTELASQIGVTEEKIAAYEPVSATEADLSDGQTTGTISATVVVFYTNDSGNADYFSTPVSIRVEEYSAKSYIEQAYGSYDAVAAAFVEYEERINALEAALESADVDSIETLSNELAACKAHYAELVELLASYVSDNTADSTGYFGTTTDEQGNTSDVVFIEGNATEYTDTGVTDDNGNTVYSAEYDIDGDGNADPIHFTVQDDGIHLTDESGNEVNSDGSEVGEGESGTVYKDTLGALQRQLTAQIDDLKAQLDACDAGLAKVKEALANAGINYDELTGETDYDKIAEAIDQLSEDLNDAQAKADNYANALNTIYNRLTGEDLSAEDAASLSSALTAINTKIDKLQSDFSVATATVADLRARLADAQTEVSNLTEELNNTTASLEVAQASLDQANAEKTVLVAQYEQALADRDEEAAAALQAQIEETEAAIAELESTKNTLEQKTAALAEAQATVASLESQIAEKEEQIASLTAQVEALSSTAEGYTITVNVANTMFGADLDENASAEDISNAVNDYVRAKMDADATIAAIQSLVNTTATGDELVTAVSDAISNGSGSTGTDYTGYTKDTDVNTESASYQAGYEAGASSSSTGSTDYTGYTKDTAVNTSSASYQAGYKSGQESVNTSTYYNQGYAAGYTDGVKATSSASSSNNSTESYNNGYTAGYSAGQKSVNTSQYYNEGYSAGVKSVDTSKNGETYKSGYNDGYSKGLKDGRSSSTATTTTATTGTGSTGTTTTASTSGGNGSSSSGSTSSSGRTGTTGTGSGSSTSSTNSSNGSSSRQNGTEAEDELEGSTVGINATATGNPESTGVSIGTVVTRNLPTTTSTDPEQKATVYLNNLNADSTFELTTNAASYENASAESMNNAYKIIEYYKDHLLELGKLGSDEITNAATNDNMEVSFNVLSSVDVTASDEQKTAIAKGEDADVKFTSVDFAPDTLYLVIHESEVRDGEFDVMLSEATGNTISMSLPDLSPVTFVSVSVDQIASIDTTVDETGDEGSPEAIEEQEDTHPYAAVAYILILIAVGALVVLFLQIKKRGGFNFKKK